MTKIIHFNPLGIEEAREILGKLIAAWNERLEDRGVTLTLAESAVELILQKGFSAEFGARNLERTMDSLLGNLVAEALNGEIPSGGMMRLIALNGEVQIRSGSE